MNIMHLLAAQLGEHKNKPAIITSRRTRRQILSFGELACRIDAMAWKLCQAELCPGQRVLILQPMSVDLYVAILGAWQAGLTVMFIDPAQGLKTLAACLRRTPAQALIAPWPIRVLAPLLRPLRALSRLSVGPRWRRAATRTSQPVVRNDAEPALITFTSGSTGLPAPVIRSHGFMRTQLEILNRAFPLPAGSIDLVAMPMFVLPNLANGITSLLPACDVRNPAGIDAARLAQQINQEQPRRLLASPALLDRLATHCLSTGQVLPLPQIVTGGAPAFPDMLDRIRRSAPDTQMRLVYGSSEAEPMSFIDLDKMTPADQARQRDSGALLVGRPVDSLRLRLKPMRCARSAVPEDAVALGVVQVTGEHVLGSRQPGAWHDTGDVAYRDASGRLWLLGRQSAVINDSHGTVFPFPATTLARSVTGVRDACIVQYRGQRVMIMQLHDQHRPNRLILHQRLRPLRVQHFVFCKKMPLDKRHNGKIDRRALSTLLERAFAQRHQPPVCSSGQGKFLVDGSGFR